LAYVAHYLQAHHSPDLFHVQHERVKAVSGPMATKERAAHKALTEATEELQRLQHQAQGTAEEPEAREPSAPPKNDMSLQQAEQVLDAARHEHECLAQQREQVKASLKGIGHDYHFVDLERGVRRNGQLIAADLQGHIEQIRSIAQQEQLSQSCLERIDKAERVVPKMQATAERFFGQKPRSMFAAILESVELAPAPLRPPRKA
jgi:hypothetical protein